MTTPFANLEMKQAARVRKHLPGGGELAQRVRNGATIPELCTEYAASKTVIYTRLRSSGYTASGLNAAQELGAPRPTPSFIYEPEPEDWRDHALCSGAVTCPEDDYWHPEGKGPAVTNQESLAKAICADCPVREACLAHALRVDAISGGPAWGVFGGLNPDERKKLRKKGVIG